MTITNYSIIDVQPSATQQAINKAYKTAKAEKSEYIFTLDEFCKMITDEPSNALKWFIRSHKTPSNVYIVADDVLQWAEPEKAILSPRSRQKAKLENRTITPAAISGRTADAWQNKELNQIAFCWQSHVDNIFFITENEVCQYDNPYYYGGQFQDSDYTPEDETILSEWQQGFDYSFSAKLYHENSVHTVVDGYGDLMESLKNKNGGLDEKMQRKIYGHGTYIKRERAIPRPSEIDEYKMYVNYILENHLENEFCDIDYQICPVCGKPIKVDKSQFDLSDIHDIKKFQELVNTRTPETNEDITCTHCGKFRIPYNLMNHIDVYYDDSYIDEPY